MANEVTISKIGKLKFGLRHLFALITTLAVLIWASLRLYEWYVSVPLSTAVKTFNSRVAADPALKSIAPLTEEEIVAAIQSSLKSPEFAKGPQSSVIPSKLNRIASSRRLPKNAWLEMNPNYQANSTERVWRIDLNAMIGQNIGLTTTIRRIAKPSSLGNDVEPAAFSFPASPLAGP